MPTQEEIEKMSPEEIQALQKQNCPFCKIVAGEIPSNKVYEDDKMLAITDINPATKGHLLILPKEHYPILPLVPKEIFDHIFETSKLIAQGVKEAVLSESITMFIANGAIAGQQSPHFLFHIIPRNTGDGLEMLSVGFGEVDQQSILQPLEHNLPIMMRNQLQERGISPSSQQSPDHSPQSPVSSPSPEQMEERRALIAKILDENDDVRELLKNDPKQFQETINQNEQLKQIFTGVDLQTLSNHLKDSPLPEHDHENDPQVPKEINVTNENKKEEPLFESKVEVETNTTSGLAGYTSQSTEAETEPDHSKQNADSSRRPEVFLGSDPYKQRDAVFEYLDHKPKARELLINDTEHFKEILSTRPDVQPLFQDVDIDKLAQKLKEVDR